LLPAARLRIGAHAQRFDKTLGIIGLGTIGKKVARLARAFTYYDIVPLSKDAEDRLSVRFRLLRESHRKLRHRIVARRSTTRGMIGAEELALMKPEAILINTCR
jgi:glyoxylate reductase/D-3-phosphoglycerate dehydrogenase